MKKTYVGDIKPADTINDVFVLSEKILAQKKDGNNYLNLVLSDKTGTIKGVVWDNADRVSLSVAVNDVVQIHGVANEYKGELQLVVKKMAVCSPEAIDPRDFVPVTERNIENMLDRLIKLSAELRDPNLRTLLEAFWNDTDFVQKFKSAPAAKKMHHAYIGGLLEHTLSMAVLAEKIAGHYSGVNIDLLLAGVVLHDIGKIREFEYKFFIDYSDEGRLLNHIIIGLQMLEEKLKGLEDFPYEKAVLLKHMIVSHHGARDFGSPEPPKTLEAMLLNYIDEIDSKISGVRDFMATEDPEAIWTSYHKILERYFYKGKKK
ncbi:MAG: HD domain-containing protein [Deltaproteobacteria bacterium]|nr:HD domain-containing protein [Deltaproteobacteria bacterium]MBW1960611.1 HD domain-containing protein [Deltaproteobacteria bacterium]MBW1993198.1 HD domain-containing protein [Deltaproteobacteria bacterium]MBW2151131.1 HD domain-containing protein [Deltaproteobacteria bacterium]